MTHLSYGKCTSYMYLNKQQMGIVERLVSLYACLQSCMTLQLYQDTLFEQSPLSHL